MIAIRKHPPTGWTIDDMMADLKLSGVRSGDLLVVHSSLSRMGYVAGGAAAVVEALVHTVGPTGTVVFPALTFEGSMTRFLRTHEQVDLRQRPSHNGAIPRAAGQRRDASRSVHPTHTVIAIGPAAPHLFAGNQDGQGPTGPASPFARAAMAGGKIVLIGVDCSVNTTLHCVEEQAAPYIFNGEVFAPLTIDLDGRGHRIHVRGYTTATHRHFPAIEPRLQDEGIMTIGHLGSAPSRLCDGRRLLTEVTAWVRQEPYLLGTPNATNADAAG
ncbi:MAG: AAC(3) family N-acetyltransferase [Planctomycetota bacterium]